MRSIIRFAPFLILVSLTAYAQPDWVTDTKRRVIGGDIIHWGTGRSSTSEIALFKARHMAIKAILEECGGFAHKEIVPEKRYVEKDIAGDYVAYAKVFISKQSCSYGQDKYPSKDMENKKILEGQKFYDQLLGNTTPQEEEEIRKWILEENDRLWSSVKSEHDSTQEQINYLKQELKMLKASIKLQKRPVMPLRVPATTPMKAMCWKKYQTLIDQAMMDAAPYGANLAHPAARPMFNAAQREKQICLMME